MNKIFLETRMFRLSGGEEIMTLAFFFLIQYRSVTDRRTDRRTDGRTILLWLYQRLHSSLVKIYMCGDGVYLEKFQDWYRVEEVKSSEEVRPSSGQ